MALTQRYSTELSTHTTGRTSLGQVVNDVAAIQQKNVDEKRYLHSLNDRLEELLHHLDSLELGNKKLRDELNLLITSWGIGGENRARFLQELDGLTRNLSETRRRKIVVEVETKVFAELAQLTDRVTAIFLNVHNSYQDKIHLLNDLIKRLEEEFRKIQLRLNISQAQVKSYDDDYQRELAKSRSYLAEWSRIALDKQNLLNEIQALKELAHLRAAYRQEEINEWNRLLNHMSQDSKNFYRDYLDTIKQQIRLDYEQMSKDQQADVEIQLQSRLKQIEQKIQMGLPLDENDERRRREETQRFESRLTDQTKEHDQLQSSYRTINEEVQRKRRVLQDLENEARNKARKNAEQHARLEQDTNLTRAEYYALKDELDKLAYTLRFTIEEELKIYEALLNSVNRKTDVHTSVEDTTKYRYPTVSKIVGVQTTTDQDRNLAQQNIDRDRYAVQQNLVNQNETTTTTTRTTRRFGQENDGQLQQININMNRSEQEGPELDEKYLQSKLHITRKYKGNVLIKFVDVRGRFVEIENTGGLKRDLTGWYIERVVDGRPINYTFPAFELDPHATVRIYGNYHQRSSSTTIDEPHSQLIAPNFYDWGIGRQMRTELFNRDDVGKALFEQKIKD